MLNENQKAILLLLKDHKSLPISPTWNAMTLASLYRRNCIDFLTSGRVRILPFGKHALKLAVTAENQAWKDCLTREKRARGRSTVRAKHRREAPKLRIVK